MLYFSKARFLLSFIVFFSITISLNAQSDVKEKATQWILQTANQLNLSETDKENFIVLNAYTDPSTNITFIHIQQTFAGVKVYNAISALAYKDGVLVSKTNGFAPGIELHISDSIVTITPQQAVNLAALNLQMQAPVNLLFSKDKPVAGNIIEFETAGKAKEKISVEKYWVRKDGTEELTLAWNINIGRADTPDWWNVRINTKTGAFIEKDNRTSYCNFSKGLSENLEKNFFNGEGKNLCLEGNKVTTPPSVTNADYRVLPLGVESPNHGSFAIEHNPWLKAGAVNNATTNGWHYDGTTDYIITRGNNVFVYLDTSGVNGNPVGSDTSTTPTPNLTFTQIPDFTQSPKTLTNRKAALTNLFYWENICHDITYQYGFTEAAGNFQTDNLGRGGFGNDYLKAEMQDVSGINNANFSTPVDGASPRFQTYLWTSATPNLDGAFDNGITTHEFFHGVTNRLNGNSSCLGNSETPSEGWSDYNFLMLTTNWATAAMADSVKSRPVGTYVLNQPVTGPGLRRHPYNYNLTINPVTYADMSSNGQIFAIGEIWCSALWDMTWNIIAQQNLIGPNMYDTASTGGNIIAYKLVIMALKLEPCQPGFIDARNAILKADSILYNKAHFCAIYKAFARRGMGVSASQGSSNNTNDQVAAFDIPSSCNAALPLTLLSFIATKYNGKVLLSWSTTNEINTDHFEIEKSTSLQQWSNIGNVRAINNFSYQNNYLSYDHQPLNGINYYRLKMFDRDGNFKYSEIQTINYEVDKLISIQPNPGDKEVVIKFNTDNISGIIKLTDAQGKLIFSKQLTAFSQANFVINTSSLSNGIYIIHFINQNEKFVQELLVNHN